MSVALVSFLLLLLLGQSVAIAPGDEDERCPVPEYPVNVKVLMDSWRYQTLLGEEGIWTATTDERHQMTWSSQATCGKSSVSVCSGGRLGKWLITQFINKSLPAPDRYPVRIFVNVTYSFMNCPRRQCDQNFKLLLANYSGAGTRYSYGEDGIMPDNQIQTTGEASSVTKQVFFDYNTSVSGFALALKSYEACVRVSRVLVYRYECPGHDRQSTGLGRRPATQAPVTGAVPVTPFCTENAHFSDISNPDTLECMSEGLWNNDQTHCECNTGYSKDKEGDLCEGGPVLVPAATSSITGAVAHKTTTMNNFTGAKTSFYPSTTPSLPPSGTPEKPTAIGVPAGEEDSGGSDTLPIFAGVGALLIVIISLVLVVVALLIALVRKNKKSKQSNGFSSSNENQLSNPVYDTVAHNVVPTSNFSGHKQDGDHTLCNFSNPLYRTSQHSIRSKGVPASHLSSRNGNTYFEEPQYSIPNGNKTVKSEYEVPVTTPTSSEGPSPPPPLSPPAHLYDYAAVPPAVAPEYATLEPPVHAYHTLEFPSDSNGTVPAVSVETEGGGGRGGGGEEGGETRDVTDGVIEKEQEYSIIAEK